MKWLGAQNSALRNSLLPCLPLLTLGLGRIMYTSLSFLEEEGNKNVHVLVPRADATGKENKLVQALVRVD